ncbi:MAG: hypothetical protein ACI3XI_02730, partial [Eubacteriales bacterium]
MKCSFLCETETARKPNDEKFSLDADLRTNQMRKVLVNLFQKVAPSKARSLGRRLRTNQMMKSFRQPFSKGCGFSRQSLESRSAERETFLTPFLFAKLFLCGFSPKEK